MIQMDHTSASLRVFKIAELARPIANQLVLTSHGRSAANLGRVCRYLEDPALNALWEAQPSLYTLLKVLPIKTWRIEDMGWSRVVCGLDLPPVESSAQVQGHCSSELWGIRRRRLGPESSATRLGCAGSVWMTRGPSGRTPSANYVLVHQLADGSQHCKFYTGVSRK